MNKVTKTIKVKLTLMFYMRILFIKTVAFLNIEKGYELLDEFKSNINKYIKIEVI